MSMVYIIGKTVFQLLAEQIKFFKNICPNSLKKQIHNKDVNVTAQ